MKHSPIAALTAIAVLGAVGVGVAGVADCSDGSCTITPPAAWAQVRTVLPDTLVEYPRHTFGATLRNVAVSTQLPTEGEDTLCDGRVQLQANYRSGIGAVAYTQVGSRGADCGSGDPPRFRCSTTTVRGLGTTRDCVSATRRAISWGNYTRAFGGDFELLGPRTFPLVAMARSVR